MKNIRSVFTLVLVLVAFFPSGGSLAHRKTSPASASREDAYRANNIGVALLEQFKHKEGAESFKNALKIDPKLNLARVNLSIALFNVPDLPAAQREAQNAMAVAPEFPQRASERNITGWVDVEFTVGTDGKTRNIVVTDASHETMFRREAMAAVEKWQFEPRVFMGRPIEQTSYTRIRFVL
jgi:TonB family protein